MNQGILHPMVARVIWSDDCPSLSPYRFCNFYERPWQSCGHNCSEPLSLSDRLYVLDFAGGGAVHLLGEYEFIPLLFILYIRVIVTSFPSLSIHDSISLIRWNGWFDSLPVC